MRIQKETLYPINFQNAGINAAAYLEENVMLNKALLDASVDIPFVCLANNNIEKKERLRRVLVNYSLCFLSPFLTLPLTNRLALKNLTKITSKFFAKESNIIEISNKYLVNKNFLKEGLNKLEKQKNNELAKKLGRPLFKEEITDYSKIIEKFGGDYEKLRKKLINAKTSVLGFDFLFSTGSVCGMAFLNNRLTKKETNKDGYSAEFELADKETVKKRAEKYKKTEPLRESIAIGLVAALTAFPLLIKRGLIQPQAKGFLKMLKQNAYKFDYTEGIFMKRLPLFMFLTGGMCGVSLAARNKTELKNQLILNGTGLAVYFGGDILVNSLLSKLSDKIFKTEIIDKNAPKTFINKFIPPTVPIKELKGKSKSIAALNFFINLATIAISYGYGVPTLINKIVRKDLKKEPQTISQKYLTQLKTPHLENFISNRSS